MTNFESLVAVPKGQASRAPLELHESPFLYEHFVAVISVRSSRRNHFVRRPRPLEMSRAKHRRQYVRKKFRAAGGVRSCASCKLITAGGARRRAIVDAEVPSALTRARTQ